MVGDVINGIRAKHKDSQAALGKILNLSQRSVSLKLRGIWKFNEEELKKLSEHYKVPVSIFFED